MRCCTVYVLCVLGAEAWAGVIVDTRGVRPCGNKAHNLWRRWSSAKVVVSGVWAANSVGILASSKVTVWRWRQPVSIGGIPIVVSHSPVPPSITVFIDRMNGRAALCFTSTNDPRIIAEEVVGGQTTGHVMIGVLMKVNSASLYRTGEALGTVAARRALSLLTLSVSDTQLVVDAHGAFECAVDHGGGVRHAARYAAFIWDGKCRAFPCWTHADDRDSAIL